MRNKKLYLEVLRLIAFLFVVFNHTGQYGYDLFATTSSEAVREIVILLANLSKCGVPIFLMISGALLIPKKETLADLYKKRVLRAAVVLLVISLIYYVRLYVKHPEYGFSPKFFVQTIYTQPFVTPLWFLYVYLAFLIMLPLMRVLAAGMSERDFGYFILAAILLTYIPPILNPYMGGGMYLSVPLLASAFCYPLAGYYLDAVFNPVKIVSRLGKIVPMITKKFTTAAIFIPVLNAILCLYYTVLVYSKTGGWTYDYIESFILIPSMCIFYIAKSLAKGSSPSDRAYRIITHAGSCVCAIYLFEEMIREDIAMNIYRTFGGSCPLLILFIPYAVTVFAAGIIVASLLKLIPGVKRFL